MSIIIEIKTESINMSKRCQLTGKTIQSGNNVSHANNRTRRRFLPNLQVATVLSERLGSVRLRLTTSAIRTIDHTGGLDAYLKKTANRKLPKEALILKKRIEKMESKQAS
jgi:large subunit ribosomal protein L28